MFPLLNRRPVAHTLCNCGKQGPIVGQKRFVSMAIPITIFGRYSDVTCDVLPPAVVGLSAEVNFVKGGINELN